MLGLAFTTCLNHCKTLYRNEYSLPILLDDCSFFGIM